MTNEAQYHRAYGRHSLIPECCIKFFVDEWLPNYINHWRDTAYNKTINKSKYGYVPCPKCFKDKKLVKIKQCETECKKECYKEYEMEAI